MERGKNPFDRPGQVGLQGRLQLRRGGCLADDQVDSGTALYLNSPSWFFGGDDMPTLVGNEPARVSGTSVWEYHYLWSVCLGCKSPKRNAYQTGFS